MSRKLACGYKDCGNRRVHHERQDTPRGTQYIDVPDDFKGDVAYCSITCACMAGAYNVNTGWVTKDGSNK